MSPKRTDTRERIVEVALDLFAEQGYEKTSLREIAEQLGITKAALYYHFPSKEALLAGLMDSALGPFDELVEWAHAQPRSAETRRELLRRLGETLQGDWSRLIRFAQENQPALRGHEDVSRKMRDLMTGLVSFMVDPEADLHDQLRALLALVALYLGEVGAGTGMAATLGITATEDQLRAAVTDVALELAG